MGLIAILAPLDYEHEHRFTEHEHDVLTPCQIVCDPLSQGVGSGASQKTNDRRLRCNPWFWLIVVLVLVLVLERR